MYKRQGQCLVQETYISVVWPWIFLPAAICLAVLVLLVAVAVTTKRSGTRPWKDSSIASFFHGTRARKPSTSTTFCQKTRWKTPPKIRQPCWSWLAEIHSWRSNTERQPMFRCRKCRWRRLHLQRVHEDIRSNFVFKGMALQSWADTS